MGDCVGKAISQWRTFLARSIDLTWGVSGREHYARFGLGEFVIRPSGTKWVLQARFQAGVSRTLSCGSLEELKRLAEALLRIGGPFGGSSDSEVEGEPRTVPNPGRPGSRSARRSLRGTPPRRPLVWTDWKLCSSEPDSWVHSFGVGYEARVRPIGDQHALFVISPRGTFCLDRFGLVPNLTSYANWFSRTFDDRSDDFGPEVKPFHIRVRGVPLRLIYTPVPALAGHLGTALGDVFLFMLEPGVVALVVQAEGGEPSCVASGSPSELNGTELCQQEFPGPLLEPGDDGSEQIVNALERVPLLADPIRTHLAALARAAIKDDGTKTARILLWAAARGYASGRRADLLVSCGKLSAWLFERGYLTRRFDVRSQREAIAWLEKRSPLFERRRQGRESVWIVRFSWFGTPSPECLARIAAI